jgi:hypothetical protein
MIPARLIVSIGVGLVYTIGHLRKENKALAEGNRMLYSALKTRSEQLQYLANLLDEHGIEIDEFDMIVLTQEL